LLIQVNNLKDVENSSLINEFYEFMKYNNSSERHIINNLKVIINFDRFFKSEKRLKDIKRQDITTFLDSKIKSSEIDPE
jgi:hypothetical protein